MLVPHPSSYCVHRCLQEPWGHLVSIFTHTGKHYSWMRFSEDCLYLNVYAPVRAPGDPPLPVGAPTNRQPRAHIRPSHRPAPTSAFPAR